MPASPGSRGVSSNVALTSGIDTDEDGRDGRLPSRADAKMADEDQLPSELSDTATPASLELSVLAARLARDGELHALLASERLRCSVHKDNYAGLKNEYTKLLHEKQSLESQLLASEEDRKEALEALSTALASAQDQATSALAQLNELKSQLPTEIDRWELEASAHAISETRWQSRIKDLSEELDASKLSMTIMIEENAKLRLALNRTAEEGERALEEASGLAAIKVQLLERQLAEIMASRETKSDSAGGADCEKLTQEAQRLRQRLRLAEDAAEDQGDRCRRLNAALARAGADAATRESELSARLAAVEAELTEVRQQRVKLAEDARREREKAQIAEAKISVLSSLVDSLRDNISEIKSTHVDERSEMKLKHAKERAQLTATVQRREEELKGVRFELAKALDERDRARDDEARAAAVVRTEADAANLEAAATVAQLEARLAEVVAKNRSLALELAEVNRMKREKVSAHHLPPPPPPPPPPPLLQASPPTLWDKASPTADEGRRRSISPAFCPSRPDRQDLVEKRKRFEELLLRPPL